MKEIHKKRALFAGTFDPITYAHLDIVKKFVTLSNITTIVAVAENTPKETLFSLEERVLLAQEELSKKDNIIVKPFSGTLESFAKKEKISILLRGARDSVDFSREIRIRDINNFLNSQLETIIMIPAIEKRCISSGFVKEIAKANGDLSRFVSKKIADAVMEKINTR